MRSKKDDWFEAMVIIAVTFALLSLLVVLRPTDKTPTVEQTMAQEVHLLKKVNVDETGLQVVFSFTYNDSYGVYHCIYFSGGGGANGGLWCERVENTTVKERDGRE